MLNDKVNTTVEEIREAGNRAISRKEIIKLKFPCEVHQTGDREITIELSGSGPQMFTDEFFEGLQNRMGTSRAEAFMERMKLHVIRHSLMAEIESNV